MKYLWLLFLFILLGCSKEQVVICYPYPTTGDQIDFQEMAVGQKNAYLGLEGENYWENGDYGAFAYVDDTLYVEIIDEDNNRYQWMETLTDPSQGNDSITYWVHVENDSLVIDGSDPDITYSNLWFSFFLNAHHSASGIMKIPLTEFQDLACDIKGWKTDLPYSESYREAYDPNFELFNIGYGRVNVIIDNVPMQVDGPGKTYVYNSTTLIRTSQYSWWTGTGWGWDLLPTK